MEYRKMEKLGVDVSLLGFGCMRFPLGEGGKIDESEAQKMLDLAIESGVNYIDTAYVYHGGESEKFLGKALKKHDRSKLHIATKLPVWMVKTLDDADRLFKEQCDRLQTDYIDFYLLHALNRHTFKNLQSQKVIEWAMKLKKEGKIKNLGFSFHDGYDAFEEIIKAHDWDFCQIQYNYMDQNEQAGTKGYELAESLGIPMVIMEPIKGGALANLPDSFTEIFKKINPDASNASWALRWVASHPNVKVVLSGMSTFDQVTDNLKTFNNFKPIDSEEAVAIKQVSEEFRKRVRNGCTECGYCLPCPNGVFIPRNFNIWNQLAMFKSSMAVEFQWADLPEEQRAGSCVECGECEAKCPQKISIIENLKQVAKEMAALQESHIDKLNKLRYTDDSK